MAGVVVGGVVFGALGFLFAPQVGHAMPANQRPSLRCSLSPQPTQIALPDPAAASMGCLQISKALLGDDQRLKLPRFMEEEQPKDPEQTKQDLIEVSSREASPQQPHAHSSNC
jgi:hypothetical protein